MPVITVLVGKRRLDSGHDLASVDVWAVSNSQGGSAFQHICICRPPCTSHFQIVFFSSSSAQMLTCNC